MRKEASMEEGAIQEQAPPKVFSINVLQLIKTGQAQHGCRYGDYQRYRKYCFSRLRRLYKSLKYLHGRGKYSAPKKLDVSTVSDVRHLHIPLYCAERAWGYAMELKQVEGGPDFSAKRHHMLQRLTKAAKCADAFLRLCAERADPKTALEAEAYASYMWGSVLVEKEQDLESALSKFLRARAVYEQLGQVGDVEQQVLCRQRAEEMEPSIRFCNYKLGRTDGATMGHDLLLLSGEDGPAGQLLQSKLEAVLEEARSQQAATMTELEWLGTKLPVLNAKTRLCILRAQQLEAEASAEGTTNERKLNLFDKIFAAYHDAKRHIREDLVAAGSAEDVKEQLSALDRAVSCLLLQRTVDRNWVLVASARQRLARAERRAAEHEVSRKHKRQKAEGGGGAGAGGGGGGEGGKGPGEGAKEKPAKPEDLIRLYDTLVQNLSDLQDLASSGRSQSAAETALGQQLEARKVACEAARCAFVGLAYAAAGKAAEAYAVLGLAATRLEHAMGVVHKEGGTDAEAQLADLQALQGRCQGLRATLRAQAALDSIRGKAAVEAGVAGMGLKEHPNQRDQGDGQYLMQALDQFVSALPPEGSKLPPRIAQLPPPLCAVPCRPIVLDTALNAITFPSLDGRTKAKKAAGGLFSAFFGR